MMSPDAASGSGARDRPTAFVTGATGFVGMRVAPLLADRGYDVRCLVRPHHPEGVLGDERLSVVTGDLDDHVVVRDAIRDADVVLHLAAIVGDWGPPDEFCHVNVDGTRGVFDAALESGTRVVLASSITVYGDGLESCVCSEDVGHGRTFGSYGETKQAQERLAREYAERGLDVVALRLGNIYGPASPVWVDEPVEYLATGLPSLIGGGHGDALLLHVDNAAAALVAAARLDGAAGRTYNVVDDSGITWRQYFGDLARITGASTPRSMPLVVARSLASVMETSWRALGRSSRPPLTREALSIVSARASVPIDRAREELGYDPPVDYEEGMRGVAEYLRGV